MNNGMTMINLAGNPVSIFLFQFVLRKNAISFVVNESIAEDMYPDIDEQLQPLVQVCSETLMRHKTLCRGDTIMDGNILVDGCFEVMLSKGLGKLFGEIEKQNLFNDAHELAKLLMEVMDRRTKEMQQGTYPGPQPVIQKIQRTKSTSKGLESLGEKKKQLDDLQWDASNHPGLKRLKPSDLPDGVVAKRGYDHRGYCIAFVHEAFGDLGKIIISEVGRETLMEAELSKENPQHLAKKEAVLEEVIMVVETALRNIAARKNR